MPRFGGDGGGGGESAPATTGESLNNSNAHQTAAAGWFGGATRTVTGGATGANYVVLGGTRYGLRLSQVRFFFYVFRFSKIFLHLHPSLRVNRRLSGLFTPTAYQKSHLYG